MQFLPRQEEVSGWLLEADPLVFPAEQIMTRIGRDADHFRRYDVIDMTVGEYRRVPGPGFASIEIFRFPDFIMAFGAYSTRRSAVANFLDIGNESFVGPHSIHIWRGPFYVRIIGGGSQALMDPLKELAAAVAERMPAVPSKPAIFNYLPENYRVINSESYTTEPVFGQPFLRNSFTALYDYDGSRIEGLILPATSKQQAAAILGQYRNFFATNGRLLDPITNLGEDNFTAEDQYQGRTVAFRLDRFVIAFKGYDEKQKLVDLAILADQRILGTIKRQLEGADKAAARVRRGENPDEKLPPWEASPRPQGQ